MSPRGSIAAVFRMVRKHMVRMKQRMKTGFVPLMKPLPMIVLAGVIGVALLSFSGYAADTFAMLLDLLYGGRYEQAAIDTANAFSYAISCSAIMHAFPPPSGDVNTDWGPVAVEGMNETWYEGPATSQINSSCHAATKNNGVSFGPTNVRVTCDELAPDRGMHHPDEGAEDIGDCEVKGATLPQETSGNSIVDQWLKANGMPKYVLYYQALPVKAKKDYMMTTAPYNMWAIAIAAGGAMIPAAGSALRAARGTAVSSRLSSKFYAGIRSTAGQGANWMFRRFTAMLGHRAVRSSLTMGNGLGAYTVRVSKYATRHFQSSVGRQIAGDWAASFSGKLARAMRENGIRYLTDENNVAPLVRQASSESGAAMSSGAARDIAERVATDFDWAVRLHDDFAGTSREASRRAATKFLLAAQSAADDTVGSLINVGSRARRVPGGEATASYASKLNQYATRAEKTFTGRLPDRVSSASMRDAAIGSACHGFAARQEVAELATEVVQETVAENSEWLGETGVCAAYSGLASGGISRVCRAAGVSNVRSGWFGGGLTSTGACGFLVMAGHESMKATSTAVPTTPQHINSLYLARPWTGPEPFPLNKYAQWYFVKLNRQGSDNTRFHLMSPMYTRNLTDADDPRFVVDFDYTQVRQSSTNIIHDNNGNDAPNRATASCYIGDIAIGWVDFWAGGPPIFQQFQELAGFVMDSDEMPFRVSKDALAVKGISDGFQISNFRRCLEGVCVELGCDEVRITPEPWVQKGLNVTDGNEWRFGPSPPGWTADQWDTTMATRLAVDPAWPVEPHHAQDDGNGRRFESLMQPPNVTRDCVNGCDWEGEPWEFERPMWKYMFSSQARGAQIITDVTNGILPTENLQSHDKHDVPTMTVRDVGFPDGKWEHPEAQHNFGYQGSQHEAEFWAAITRYGPLYVEIAAAAVLAPFSGGTSLVLAFTATMAAMNGGGEYVSQAIGKDHAWPCHYNGCESLYPDELIPGVD